MLLIVYILFQVRLYKYNAISFIILLSFIQYHNKSQSCKDYLVKKRGIDKKEANKMLQITDNFDYPEDKMAAKPKASGGLAKKGL